MLTRRDLLGSLVYGAALGVAAPLLRAGVGLRAHPLRDAPAWQGKTPEEVAQDESYWFMAQQAFTVDRSLINFNNGGVSPSPALVQEAMRRYLEHANSAPSYVLWELQEPQRETVRTRLAALFGCDPEEIAITRNASEGLEICQLGFDLEAGDEVLTTTQDYPRMLATFRQRELREKIVLRKISLPVPCEDPAEVVRRFDAAIGERTRLILICHMINLTGQILPVKEVVALGRARGIPVIVDGAHSFAHFCFTHRDLDCDYYATSLHKWLFAPHGTGALYVRRDRIHDLWPLMAPPEEKRGDIRKFEEIGTHPAANFLAIGAAISFHEGVVPERKEARMRFLRDRWARRLAAHSKVRLHTSLDPRFSCGIGTVEIDGVDPVALREHLFRKHRILTVAIVHEEFRGLRVSPSIYTTLEEVDLFCDAMEQVIERGLPG